MRRYPEQWQLRSKVLVLARPASPYCSAISIRTRWQKPELHSIRTSPRSAFCVQGVLKASTSRVFSRFVRPCRAQSSQGFRSPVSECPARAANAGSDLWSKLPQLPFNLASCRAWPGNLVGFGTHERVGFRAGSLRFFMRRRLPGSTCSRTVRNPTSHEYTSWPLSSSKGSAALSMG